MNTHSKANIVIYQQKKSHICVCIIYIYFFDKLCICIILSKWEGLRPLCSDDRQRYSQWSKLQQLAVSSSQQLSTSYTQYSPARSTRLFATLKTQHVLALELIDLQLLILFFFLVNAPFGSHICFTRKIHGCLNFCINHDA